MAERGSVIDAQVELSDCIQEEIQRCKNDPHYFYLNYSLVDGKATKYREADKHLFDMYQKAFDEDKGLLLLQPRHRPEPLLPYPFMTWEQKLWYNEYWLSTEQDGVKIEKLPITMRGL